MGGEKMEEQKKGITLAVAARLKYLRFMKGYSQEALALSADINPAYYGQVERGLKCPTVDTLYKLAKAMEVPLPELFKFEAPLQNHEQSVERLENLLARVPPDKLEKVFKAFESVVDLL